MSRIPTGTLRFSKVSILFASRCASGTPRRRIPINASRSRSLVFSSTSCARRTSVRSISEALISWAFSRVRDIRLRMTEYHDEARPSPQRRRDAEKIEKLESIQILLCPLRKRPDGIEALVSLFVFSASLRLRGEPRAWTCYRMISRGTYRNHRSARAVCPIMEAMATDAVCSKCEGTGFIIIERGGISGAEPCDCRAQGRTERLQDRSQIPALYCHASFDNFVVPGIENPTARRELTTVLLAVKKFASDFPHEKGPQGLLLIGEVGCGKTHLAVAALRQIIAKGFEGLFYSYQALLDNIHKGYDPVADVSDRNAYRTAMETEVLLLDDIAAQRAHDWVEDTINSIVTYRCDNRKALIATTNAPDTEAG